LRKNDLLEMPPELNLDETVRATLNQRLLHVKGRLAEHATAFEDLVVHLSGTHFERVNLHQAKKYPVDSTFWETDRASFYVVGMYGAIKVWLYEDGLARGLRADRYTDLTIHDANFRYYATDNYVTYRWSGTAWEPVPMIGVVAVDTHANRLAKYPATDFPTASHFLESDRGVLYRNTGSAWVYESGIMRTATIADKPTALGTNDTGFLWFTADYKHTWRWLGSAWTYEDDPSGVFLYTDSDPGAGYHLCDGSTVTRTKSDATTASVTLPDERGGSLRKGAGAYSGTVNAAVAASLTGAPGAASAGTPAGTVSQPTLTMDSYTPAGTVSAPSFSGTALGEHSHELPLDIVSETQAKLVVGSPFASSGHTRTANSKITTASDASNAYTIQSAPTSAGTPSGTMSTPSFSGTAHVLTGTVSQPTFSGTAMAEHSHSAGTLAVSGGSEANLDVLPYFRL
jgi:hypothetical protein